MSTRRTADGKIRTHYDNLKVARDAPVEVIRAAYKSLSQKHHPDRNAGDPNAAHKMAIINAAYQVLSDPERRKAHDEWIRKVEAGPAVPPPPRPSAQPRPSPSVSRQPAAKKRKREIPPVIASNSAIINHLRRYWWIYGFLALVEVILLTTIMILGG
jgi:curved DNA-binding protein CbpA